VPFFAQTTCETCCLCLPCAGNFGSGAGWPALSRALARVAQIQGLPTLVFIGMDKAKPALRLEGLLPADAIKDVLKDLTAPMVGA